MWNDHLFFCYSYLENDPGPTPEFSGSPLSISDNNLIVTRVIYWGLFTTCLLVVHYLFTGRSPVVYWSFTSCLRSNNLWGASLAPLQFLSVGLIQLGKKNRQHKPAARVLRVGEWWWLEPKAAFITTGALVRRYNGRLSDYKLATLTPIPAYLRCSGSFRKRCSRLSPMSYNSKFAVQL